MSTPPTPPSSSALMRSTIARIGSELGLDSVHVAALQALPREESLLREWLNRGYQADMAWMQRNVEKRADPRLILPEAQSIIVSALNYDTPLRHDESNEPGVVSGKISRYAWGDDYHDVLGRLLDRFCAELRLSYPEHAFKYYVDTGPVLEKQWAVRAGMGWQGKHSNIISRSRGSFFFLGVILSSLPLDSDPVVQDHCGTCTACIDACPTGAIVEPYVVDSGSCISYLTIESKGDLAFLPRLRSKLDGWLYGCDTCQDVCPWNRFRTDSERSEFEARHMQASLPLNAVMSMTQEEFSARFKNSPIKRTKLQGLQRNARMLKDYAALPHAHANRSTDPIQDTNTDQE